MAACIVHERCPYCNTSFLPGVCIHYCASQHTYHGAFDGRVITTAPACCTVEAYLHDYVGDLLGQGLLQGDVLAYLDHVPLLPAPHGVREEDGMEVHR